MNSGWHLSLGRGTWRDYGEDSELGTTTYALIALCTDGRSDVTSSFKLPLALTHSSDGLQPGTMR